MGDVALRVAEAVVGGLSEESRWDVELAAKCSDLLEFLTKLEAGRILLCCTISDRVNQFLKIQRKFN